MWSIVKRIKSAIKQVRTEVTDKGLESAGFLHLKSKFYLGSLVIRQVGRFYYYKSDKGRLVKLKSMFEVSQLVYGRLSYGR